MSPNPHGHSSLEDLDSSGTADGREESELTRVERRLVREFGASVPPDVVQRCVTDTAARFDEASVPNYVPVLVERLARAWLRDAVRESEHRPALRSVPTDVERANAEARPHGRADVVPLSGTATNHSPSSDARPLS